VANCGSTILLRDYVHPFGEFNIHNNLLVFTGFPNMMS